VFLVLILTKHISYIDKNSRGKKSVVIEFYQ